jgi:peptidoglycan/LPS O-acetylase OafA/YrhL
VVTVIFMVLAVISVFIPSMVAGNDRDYSGWELLAPLTFGSIGAVLALLHRSLDKGARASWAAASFFTGFFTVPMAYIVATVVEAIDWTINGPPPWV